LNGFIRRKEDKVMDKFWMVYGGYLSDPVFKHESEQDARTEAERLARKHPGNKFYILEVIAMCQLKEFEWTELLHKEIPF
jgi:hypothetical protein